MIKRSEFKAWRKKVKKKKKLVRGRVYKAAGEREDQELVRSGGKEGG